MDIDSIKQRYSETAQEIDKLGRAILVGRLKPSQQMKAAEMAGSEATAQTVRLVCSLRGIDLNTFAFPRSRAEVDARIDMLEDEGLEALVKATMQLYGVADNPAGAEMPAVLESAKNSSKQQGSAKPAG